LFLHRLHSSLPIRSTLARALTALSCGTAALSAGAMSDTAELELPVITIATKTPRILRDSPLPGTVISGRVMERRGAQRLGDVLRDETGVHVIEDHGTGVQLQGLAPGYTLILIDGDPAVGRSAGTLDLDRFVVSGIARVEMIKGPSSSLYGSEALGGVINLVTSRPSEPLSMSVRARYATHNTLTTGAMAESKRGRMGWSLLADRTSSSGYELTPATAAHTAPAYENYTVQPKAVYEGENATLTFSPRLFWESLRNQGVYFAGPDSAQDTLTGRDRGSLLDVGASAAWEQRFSEHATATFKLYGTRYRTDASLRSADGSDSVISATRFDQRYYKAETFAENRLGNHRVLLGGGGIWESVVADRVDGGERVAYSGFFFGQEEWAPTRRSQILASGRVDAHGDYATAVSPRVAGMVRPLSWLAFRASVGKGFKAPTFQQLYMDFTNPQVGYSVFGATNVAEAVDELEGQGQISVRVRALEDYELKPEHSWSYNLGVEADAGRLFSAKVNLFRNNVRDLIETLPVAAKTNGQSVYTYFNLSRVHTYGLETEATARPARGVTLSAGYQFLVAEDEDVLDSIARRAIYKRGATGVVRPVQKAEYGGLFNRSRHSANLKAEIEAPRGFTASLRGSYRGRYGYADANGNEILDSDSEYIPGYFLWNLAASQAVGRWSTLEAGVENLFDHREQAAIAAMPTYAPSMPGRRLYAGFRIRTL
jgi:outer membrane receptor for ferrienterochelin and colicins